MKTTTIPSLRVSPNLRKQAEFVLEEGETLSGFVLDAVTRSAGDARKYVLATTNTTQVLQLDLTDKIRRDLENALDVPPPKK